jgi:DNA-binding NarL/FixJ family response regulator
MLFCGPGGAAIIGVIVADHQELFRTGMEEVLALEVDVGIGGSAIDLQTAAECPDKDQG